MADSAEEHAVEPVGGALLAETEQGSQKQFLTTAKRTKTEPVQNSLSDSVQPSLEMGVRRGREVKFRDSREISRHFSRIRDEKNIGALKCRRIRERLP